MLLASQVMSKHGGNKYNLSWSVLEMTYLVHNYAHKCTCTEDVYVLLLVIL